MSYVPLWCKSNFSFLEGASHPEELVEQAYTHGLRSLALTDRDGIYGVVRAYVKAQGNRCASHYWCRGYGWRSGMSFYVHFSCSQ
ncbi:MAG: hypothetical protein Ct9H300mP25_12240 [Acidobacteriota bacterium]|nr:MAG: hypothetical protein Ct9H300mP25_12240 [Acidobacteriota bacterium]